MNRIKQKLKKLEVVGKEVFLPFDEEGIIVDLNNGTIDFYPYKVKITKSKGLFNNIGDIIEYKENNIKFKNSELNKYNEGS